VTFYICDSLYIYSQYYYRHKTQH